MEECGYKPNEAFVKRTRARATALGPAGSTYGLKLRLGEACKKDGIVGTGANARCLEHIGK